MHTFVAGTFDRLHNGHKAVLTAAMSQGGPVTVGITSDQYIAAWKKDTKGITSFAKRKQVVMAFISTIVQSKQSVSYVAIDDPYEPAASGTYDSLIVTEHNQSTGNEINSRRITRGLSPLVLITVPIITAEDGSTLSATRVRAGEVTTDGRLVLPKNLRAQLKKPLGDCIPTPHLDAFMRTVQPSSSNGCCGGGCSSGGCDGCGCNDDEEEISSQNEYYREFKAIMKVSEDRPFITVGDQSTYIARALGYVPDLSIIDFHVQRQERFTISDFSFPAFVTYEHVSSGPGNISMLASQVINDWAKQPYPQVLIVDGEDDLLVLPVLVAAPVGSVVYYGQPNEGLVRVIVDAGVKQEATNLLQKFEVHNA